MNEQFRFLERLKDIENDRNISTIDQINKISANNVNVEKFLKFVENSFYDDNEEKSERAFKEIEKTFLIVDKSTNPSIDTWYRFIIKIIATGKYLFIEDNGRYIISFNSKADTKINDYINAIKHNVTKD